ncbi:MAG: DUF2203 family protein [Gemmataceae bacterium]|nr:DUF2203 family protein [Gemmataceae bacterium]
MKRRRGRRTKRGTLRAIRLWTYADAVKALPYLRSLTNSLREHWLELQSRQLAAKRLHDVRKPTRRDMIALEETLSDVRQSEDKFESALEEMMRQDVFLLDPVQGLALVPFQSGDELAWYVLDVFAEDPLTTWRFHKDPLETRRPVPKTPPAVAAAGSS